LSIEHKRGVALARLFQVVTLMHGGGRLTQQDIAEVCGCSDRQIRRDLLVLQAAGVPFHFNRREGYRLEDDWSPLQLSLTLQEVLALLLARQAAIGPDMPFTHSASTAFDKITALLPASLRECLEKEEAVSYYSRGRRDYAGAPWGRLLTAIQCHERLEMDYYTLERDACSVRRIDPYHIVWMQHYCQLIAYCHKRKKVINFAMDCIRGLQSTGETFTILPKFSLAEHLRGAAGPMLGDPVEIRVNFDAGIARWARRRAWGFPHKLIEQTDGSVILEGTVRGIDDIRKELLAWGRHARVLAPHSLADAMRKEACAIAALYTADEKTSSDISPPS
jgi:predicted DNA-binding transcriptional regulator YafY